LIVPIREQTGNPLQDLREPVSTWIHLDLRSVRGATLDRTLKSLRNRDLRTQKHVTAFRFVLKGDLTSLLKLTGPGTSTLVFFAFPSSVTLELSSP
jgi:hypothetical protein